MNKTVTRHPASFGVILTHFSENSGIRHAFGTRRVLDQKSLARTMDRLGLPVISVHQVHGDGILILDRPARDGIVSKKRTEAEGFDSYDAIVTNQPGVVLAIRTADCLPVLMFDPEHRVIAAAHSGWRGSLQEVVPKTIRAMTARFSCRPQALLVGIGPSIRSCCYEVGDIVLAPLAARCPYWRDLVKEKGDLPAGQAGGKAMLDLQGLVHRQLLGLGVSPDRIEISEACTACDPERFESYRRDGKAASSMWSGIVMEAA